MLKQLNGKTDRRANNMDKGELKCEDELDIICKDLGDYEEREDQ